MNYTEPHALMELHDRTPAQGYLDSIELVLEYLERLLTDDEARDLAIAHHPSAQEDDLLILDDVLRDLEIELYDAREMIAGVIPGTGTYAIGTADYWALTDAEQYLEEITTHTDEEGA